MVDNNEPKPEEENELMYIYEWVDSIELSKPKKNMARDFCDGLLIAEIIKHYIPKIVDIHNYPSSSSMKQKNYNWTTLNTKVLKKIGMQMSNKEINDVITCKPFAIERLLQRIYLAIEKTTGINMTMEMRKGQFGQNTINDTITKDEDNKEKRMELMKILEEKEMSVQTIRDIVDKLEEKLESSNKGIKAQEMKIDELTKVARSRGINTQMLDK